jgi:hypothetical protein
MMEKDKLYYSLRSLDRVHQHLEAKKIPLPKSILDFTDSLWSILKGEKKSAPITKNDRQIEKLIVDEQDATFEEILLNKYYYTLSNIILLLKEGNPLSAEATLEEALEFFRYDSANDYLSSLGGDATILTEAEEERIESDLRVQREKEQQLIDKNFSKIVTDWSSINRY